MVPETPIIKTLLDNDFYKFTMQNAVVKLFPTARVRYAFGNRGHHVFPEGFAQELSRQVKAMENLQLTRAEKDYLASKCEYLDPTYLDFLSGYRFDSSEVEIAQNGGDLVINIEGYWYRTILWEVPLMALISELYYKMRKEERCGDRELEDRTRKKIETYRDLDVRIAEFGTRRRYSFDAHSRVVGALQKWGKGSYVGTSNVHLAMKHNVLPVGTHGHEWFMFHGAKYGFKMANKLALENWVNVYRGNLGIALSDTYSTDSFFEIFDRMYAKLFDGLRHDSGDPLLFTDKAIANYRKFNVDPLSKSIIFSDGLNPEMVSRIAGYCRGKIGISFGIGTNFTNDFGPQALNMVIKMSHAKSEGGAWTPCVKLSDNPAKYTGDPEAIALAKTILNIH